MQKSILAAALLCLPLTSQDRQERVQTAEAVSIATVGKPAPKFQLNDHTGKSVSVGGPAKTWTVLAFYPKAMTGG